MEIRPPPVRTKIGALACYAHLVFHWCLHNKIFTDPLNLQLGSNNFHYDAIYVLTHVQLIQPKFQKVWSRNEKIKSVHLDWKCFEKNVNF